MASIANSWKTRRLAGYSMIYPITSQHQITIILEKPWFFLILSQSIWSSPAPVLGDLHIGILQDLPGLVDQYLHGTRMDKNYIIIGQTYDSKLSRKFMELGQV